jgi:hypothetical protein
VKTARWLPALLMMLVLAAPASATHGGIHPKFRSQGVYFHCNGETKLYQANWLAEATAESSYVPWSTSPPPGSVSDGNGCGGLDWGGNTNEVYDPVYQGSFTGNLRSMTIRLYNFLANATRSAPTDPLRLYAEIDGVALFPPGAQPSNGRTVTVTPQPGNSGATDFYEFTITNIGFANEIRDASGNVIDVQTGGAAQEDGNGTIEHTIKLFIGRHGTGLGQDPAGHNVGFWVWDTTEVPAGITFNPTAPAAATVQADLPDLG